MRIVVKPSAKQSPASLADTQPRRRRPHSYSMYTGDTQPVRVSRRRRRGLRFLTGLLGAIILSVAATTIGYAADAMYAAPWAYPVFGRPTLTGTWQGIFSTPSGVKFALFLKLQRPVLANGTALLQNYQGALVTGIGSWCDSEGRLAQNLPITGALPISAGYNGTADRLELDLDNGSSPAPGLLLMSLQGKWRGDTLVLQPMFGTWNGKTLVYSDNSPDVQGKINIALKKVESDAFPQACGTLLGAAP